MSSQLDCSTLMSCEKTAKAAINSLTIGLLGSIGVMVFFIWICMFTSIRYYWLVRRHRHHGRATRHGDNDIEMNIISRANVPRQPQPLPGQPQPQAPPPPYWHRHTSQGDQRNPAGTDLIYREDEEQQAWPYGSNGEYYTDMQDDIRGDDNGDVDGVDDGFQNVNVTGRNIFQDGYAYHPSYRCGYLGQGDRRNHDAFLTHGSSVSIHSINVDVFNSGEYIEPNASLANGTTNSINEDIFQAAEYIQEVDNVSIEMETHSDASSRSSDGPFVRYLRSIFEVTDNDHQFVDGGINNYTMNETVSHGSIMHQDNAIVENGSVRVSLLEDDCVLEEGMLARLFDNAASYAPESVELDE